MKSTSPLETGSAPPPWVLHFALSYCFCSIAIRALAGIPRRLIPLVAEKSEQNAG
jgi:hypothetical protein